MSETIHNPGAIEPSAVAQTAANLIVQASFADAEAGRFDALFDPNSGDDALFDVEAAAVRHTKPAVPGQTSDRIGYWHKPTAEEIAIGAKAGYDLTARNKYFS